MNTVAYNEWLNLVKEWANKHKITVRSAISILFEDSRYNPNGKDFIIAKDLYWGNADEFVSFYLNNQHDCECDVEAIQSLFNADEFFINSYNNKYTVCHRHYEDPSLDEPLCNEPSDSVVGAILAALRNTSVHGYNNILKKQNYE